MVRYDPKHCKKIRFLGVEGKSKSAIADCLHTTPAQLDEWAKEHPEFALALIRALDASQQHWKLKSQLGRT